MTRHRITPIVLWRALWVLPAHATRALFCVVILIGWGYEDASRAWRDTL